MPTIYQQLLGQLEDVIGPVAFQHLRDGSATYSILRLQHPARHYVMGPRKVYWQAPEAEYPSAAHYLLQAVEAQRHHGRMLRLPYPIPWARQLLDVPKFLPEFATVRLRIMGPRTFLFYHRDNPEWFPDLPPARKRRVHPVSDSTYEYPASTS